MIEKNIIKKHFKDSVKRSLVKTISYRAVILVLDFLVLYAFTKQVKIAVGFVIVSNLYTTMAYFIHERIWDKVKWGTKG